MAKFSVGLENYLLIVPDIILTLPEKNQGQPGNSI